VITEAQVRDALHDAAAAVEVDEDVAWQRAWIEVARQPRRRVRRTSMALTAAAVVVVAVLAWQLVTRDDTAPSVNSLTPPAASEPAAPKTAFDQLAPGVTVAPQTWIDAVDALAAARGNVAGALVRTDYSNSAPQTVMTSTRLAFATDTDGRYRVDDASLSSFAVAAGSTLQIDAAHKKVDVDIPAPGSPVPMLNLQAGQVLRPGAWMQETLGNDSGLSIVYLGRGAQDGREVLRFSVQFASHAVYSELGWELALDARTGVLLSSVQHFANTPFERETLVVEGFDDHAAPVRSEDVIVPGGYSIAAAVAGTPVRGLVVPAAGETVSQLLAQVRAAAP
jgi:hypothetical protein